VLEVARAVAQRPSGLHAPATRKAAVRGARSWVTDERAALAEHTPQLGRFPRGAGD
jgi:hypothetical protein